MHLRECMFKKERLAALGKFSNLGNGELLEHAIAFGNILNAVNMHHFGSGAALESVHQSFAGAGLVEHLQALGVEYQIWIAPLVYALRKFLLCWIEAVELIKTNILRTHAFRFTNMPLAGKHGLVANRSKNRGQGSLIGPRVLGEFVASKNRAC